MSMSFLDFVIVSASSENLVDVSVNSDDSESDFESERGDLDDPIFRSIQDQISRRMYIINCIQ